MVLPELYVLHAKVLFIVDSDYYNDTSYAVKGKETLALIKIPPFKLT